MLHFDPVVAILLALLVYKFYKPAPKRVPPPIKPPPPLSKLCQIVRRHPELGWVATGKVVRYGSSVAMKVLQTPRHGLRRSDGTLEEAKWQE
jgi:hypothetical protein